MPNVELSGAFIRYFDVRTDEGGTFARIHLTSNYTRELMDAMAWAELPEHMSAGELEGQIQGISMTLTPSRRELARNQVEVAVSSVTNFEVVRVAEKESKRIELRFVARSGSPDAAGLLDNYLRKVGQEPGRLRLTYNKQEKLDLADETAKTAAQAVDAMGKQEAAQ